jgi:nucleoid-associated protein YgaU
MPAAEPGALPPNGNDRLSTVPQSATPASLPQSGGLPRELQDPTRFELVAPPPQDNGAGRAAQDDYLETLRRRLEGSEPPPPRHGQTNSPREAATTGSAAVTSGGRTYVAQSNDTLTSIARKTLGTDSMDAVRAIFELNKDQLKDMDSIHAGQELRIPARPGSAPTAPPTASSARTGNDRQAGETPGGAEKPQPKPAAKSRQRQHTVKPGESYSRIAEQYLGDPKRWREVYEANKNRYPNADALPQGATIVIPDAEKKLAQR